MSQPDQHSLEALASLTLTPREAEVLFWISEGKSNQDIGVILGASTGTICKHVEHILDKLNVENRTAAAVIAIEKCHSLAQRSSREMRWPQIAVVGFIMGKFSDFSSDICEIYNTIAGLSA
jgi:Response regulator containing a CheY-like receiver domain and an HTH DNA-binding domain